MRESKLSLRLVRSPKLHAVVTFFYILDIFYMSDASFDVYVFDIFADFVALNSPPSPVVFGLGLWDALGVGVVMWVSSRPRLCS